MRTSKKLQEENSSSEDQETTQKRSKRRLLTPSLIKDYLDTYVIGQEEAKKTLSTAVYNHFKRLRINSQKEDPSTYLNKSNIILLGETGCGKTFLAQKIAQMFDVPIYIQDCTRLTETGYVGDDVESCIDGLLRLSNYKPERAACGIIVLDEVDKLAGGHRDAATRDVGGVSVQQALLKLVEGTDVDIQIGGGMRHPSKPTIKMNTSNILFIATGAFAGIERIIGNRLNKIRIGFESSSIKTDTPNPDTYYSYATAEDFRAYGMIPEFIGRFPCITNVHKLTENDLVRILTEPRDSIIKQYTELIAFDKTDVVFTDDALHKIAHYALMSKTGARGLRGILENVLSDIMYESPNNQLKRKRTTITVDGQYVEQMMSGHYLKA